MRIQRLQAGEELIGAVEVDEANHDLCLITQNGVLVRTSVASVRQTGRDARGVTLIRLQPDDQLTTIDTSPKDESIDNE